MKTKNIKSIESLTRRVLAIEILEYENKNHLSGDNKSRSEDKQRMLSEILKIIQFDDTDQTS